MPRAEDVSSDGHDLVVSLATEFDAPDDVERSLPSASEHVELDSQRISENCGTSDTKTRMLDNHVIDDKTNVSNGVDYVKMHSSTAPPVVCLESASNQKDPAYRKDSRASNTVNDRSPATADDKTSIHRKPKRETWADWWILFCVFLFNSHTGFNFSAYAILYMPLTETFESTRAAIGWIQSIEFSVSCLLGK
jgi:hypothetical protein